MKKYINPTIEIVKVDMISALCDGNSGMGGEGNKGDSGLGPLASPARKLYV